MLDSSSKLEGTDSSIVKRMAVQSLVRAMQVLYCARLWSRKYELSLLSRRRHFATRLVSYGHVMDASCLLRYSSPPQVETWPKKVSWNGQTICDAVWSAIPAVNYSKSKCRHMDFLSSMIISTISFPEPNRSESVAVGCQVRLKEMIVH